MAILLFTLIIKKLILMYIETKEYSPQNLKDFIN